MHPNVAENPGIIHSEGHLNLCLIHILYIKDVAAGL